MNCKMLAGFAVLAALSCKKTGETSTGTARLPGTWKLAFEATDSNNNRLLDANERVVLPGDSAGTITFNANGTGIERTTNTPFSFAWALINNDQQLVYDPGTPYSDTVSIHTLTDAELIMEFRTRSPYEWSGFRK